MKSKVPNFKIDTKKGSISLIFQTTSETAILKFANGSITLEIDGILVWSAEK